MTESPTVVIEAGEPYLQGHFPGNPLVPGVVILERVLEEIARRHGRPPSPLHIPAVKFLSPLRPGEPFTIELDGATSVSFTCRAGDRVLVSGTMTLRADAI